VVGAVNIVTHGDDDVISRLLTTVMFFIGGVIVTMITLQLKLRYTYNRHRLAIVLLFLELIGLFSAIFLHVAMNYNGHNHFNRAEGFDNIVVGG